MTASAMAVAGQGGGERVGERTEACVTERAQLPTPACAPRAGANT